MAWPVSYLLSNRNSKRAPESLIHLSFSSFTLALRVRTFFLTSKKSRLNHQKKKNLYGIMKCKQLQERFVGLQTCTSSLLFITAHDRQENLLPDSRLSQHPGGMDSCPTEYPESAGDQSCWCSSQWCQTYCERLAHQGKIRFLSLFSLVQYWQCTIFLVCSVHVNKKWVY